MDMEFKIFGLNLQMWKLNNTLDYVLFLTILVAGVFALVYAAKILSRGRNDSSALAKTLKTLNKSCKGDFGAFKLAECAIPESAGRADFVLIAPDGLYLGRCIGWGFKISGSIGAQTWKVADNKEVRRIANPIAELKPKINAVKSLLKKSGIDIPVSHMVIFADPYNEPTFSLEYGANSMGIKDLKKWYKALSPSEYDPKTVKTILMKK